MRARARIAAALAGGLAALGAALAAWAEPSAGLDSLFDDLAAAATEEDAAFIADEIEILMRGEAGPTAELLVDRANEAAELGALDEARALLNGVLDLAPQYAHAWTQSAWIDLMSEDPVGAIEAVNQALTLEPRSYEALMALGVALESLERWEGAYAAYERALEIYPFLPDGQARAQSIEPRARGRDL